MSKKDWETAWTPTKIRQNAEKWKLSGDAGLLLHLEESSSRLFEAFHRTENNLRMIDRDLKFTGIRLENTINDFSMLSNKQFIENRVYDEDVSVCMTQSKKDPAENAKSKELREAEMLDAVKYCLQKGCAMIDECFQKIDIRPEDFDEDDDPTFRPDPIYEPKDPFVRRPLPFIIGTKSFENSRFIGVRNEETNKESEENLSDEEIEEILPQPPPKKVQVVAPPPSAPSVSEPPQTSIPQIIAKDLRKDKGPGSDNSGLFCGSAESDQNVEPLFDDSEKYKILENDSKKSNIPVAPSKVSAVEKSPINFTPNIAASSSLFDDDEGDDLFSPVPKKSQLIIPSKSSSSSSVDQSVNKQISKGAFQTSIQPKTDNIIDKLFDESDEDDDGDLFSSKNLSSKKTSSQVKVEPTSVVDKNDSLNVINKQPDDSLLNVSRQSVGAQNDPNKLLANILSNSAKKEKPDEQKSEKNVIVTSKPTTSPVDQSLFKQTTKSSSTSIQPKSNKFLENLFDDNDDDDDDSDLFSTSKSFPNKQMGSRQSYEVNLTDNVSPDPLSANKIPEATTIDVPDEKVPDLPTKQVLSTVNAQNDARKLLANIIHPKSTKTDSDPIEESPKVCDEIGSNSESIYSENPLLPSLQKTRAKIPSASRRLPSKRSPIIVDNQIESVTNQITPPVLPEVKETDEKPPPIKSNRSSTSMIDSNNIIDDTKIEPVIDSNEDKNLFPNIENDDIFSISSASILPVTSKTLSASAESKTKQTTTSNIKNKRVSIFDDDDVEDLFGAPPALPETKNVRGTSNFETNRLTDETRRLSNNSLNSIASSNSIVGKVDENFIPNNVLLNSEIVNRTSESVFTPKLISTTSKAKSLFSDDENDDLFTSAKPSTLPVLSKSVTKSVQPATKEPSKIMKKNDKSISLFDDDDDDEDLFNVSANLESKKPQKRVEILNASIIDDDIFASTNDDASFKTALNEKLDESSKKPASVKPKAGLFDDDDSDIDIFK